MLSQFIAVGAGSALGAWLRWSVTWWLNDRYPEFPLGTLLCNLVGGLGVGVALAYFIAQHDLPPQYRLFIITGLLGGLTTFSTFSSEVSVLLMRGEYLMGGLLVTSHLLGSIILTIIGFASYRAIAA